MRHNQNRRSRSRSRKGPNPLTRSFESNGPDVKVRGTAAHVAEKYMSLARDAQSSGDIVAAENYLQHAEHYNRIVMAAQAQFQQERQAQFGGADEGGYDDAQMNGRGIRDRFESNIDEEEGDDRFDSSEEELERSFAPRQQQQPQMQDRDRSRGPRPGQQQGFDRRPDGRNDGRNDGRGEPRSDRGDRPQRFDDRGEGRNDRGYRNGNDGRQDGRNDQRSDQRPEQRIERDDRPQRFDRQDERPEQTERADRSHRPGQFDSAEEREPQVAVVGSPELPLDAVDEAPAPRRRRGRPARAENGAAPADAAPQEMTPDGAAALVAFPE